MCAIVVARLDMCRLDVCNCGCATWLCVKSWCNCVEKMDFKIPLKHLHLKPFDRKKLSSKPETQQCLPEFWSCYGHIPSIFQNYWTIWRFTVHSRHEVLRWFVIFPMATDMDFGCFQNCLYKTNPSLVDDVLYFYQQVERLLWCSVFKDTQSRNAQGLQKKISSK